MRGYLIIEVKVNDPERYEEYKALASRAIAQYGGKYLARGGATELLEGEQMPERIVILEFDSMAQAKKFHASEEYARPRQIRDETAATRMIVVEGL